MRTRTRDMVRMLATLRHSAQCRALRAAKVREALLKASEDDAACEQEEDDAAKTPSTAAPSQRRH